MTSPSESGSDSTVATGAPSAQKSAAQIRRAQRHIARRAARKARFGRPLQSWFDVAGAWVDMVFVDHGFFRYLYLNKHAVGAHAFRSAQPAPHHFGQFARAGIKTIINLRGGKEFGSYPLEKAACARYGLAFEEVRLRSREAPSVETIEEVAALLDRVAYPVLFHCKSGADRAGLMSALYLLLREDASIEAAQAQLALRFGHVRQAKTGILDAFLRAYAQAEAAARAEGRALGFLEWVRGDYDPAALTAAFATDTWRDFVLDRVLARE